MKAPDAFRTISEVAEDLDLPQHVLRFWETRFNQIKPMKRGGGRRYYRPEDVHLLRGIRVMLYAEGFTIRGVQRVLKEKGVGYVASIGQTGSVETLAPDDRDDPREKNDIPEKIEPLAPLSDTGPETAHLPTTDPDIAAAIRPAAEEIAHAGPPVSAPVRWSVPPDRLRRVEAALAELLEAKRLLDQVR